MQQNVARVAEDDGALCLGWIYIGKNAMTGDATGLLGAGVSESVIPCNEASVDGREKDREVWLPALSTTCT